MSNFQLDDLLDGLPFNKRQPKLKVAKMPDHPATKDRRTRDAVKQLVGEAIQGMDSNIQAIAKLAGKTDANLLRQAFENFESAVGGREALIEVLVQCPPTSVGGQLIGKLTQDPAFTNTNAHALYVLARKHKLPLNVIVQAFRDAKLAKIAVDTLNQIATDVPGVVGQLVVDAKNRWEECAVCEGSGRIQRINEAGEYAFNEENEPVTQLCFDCRGKGRKYVRHDFSNRSKLLDLAGLRPDKAPLVQQTFNQSANITTGGITGFLPGDGSFEALMQAVETTLRPTTVQPADAGERIMDAEIIPFEAEAPASEAQAAEPASSEPQSSAGVCEVD